MNILEFLKLSKENQIESIQIKELTNIENEIELINERVMNIESSNNINYKIKALYNNKTVEVNTDYLDETIIELIKYKAENIESNYQDIYLSDKSNNNEINEAVNININNKIPELKQIEKIRKEYKYVNKIECILTSIYNKIRIINSNGVDISSSNKRYYFYIESYAEKDNNLVSKYETILKTSLEEININKAVRKNLEETTLLLEKRKLENKKYDIILTPSVNSEILLRLTDMLSAQAIRTNQSIMTNKLNNKIFSNKITILEEPINKNYPGYRLFDDEGTKTYNKTLIENGILKTYLYDNKEALEKNIKSTGNLYGNISTKNMYIMPNEKSYEELIKEMNNGIIITNFMGSSNSSISSITGQISIQIFGLIVEKGKIISGFTPAILTTDIFELYNNTKEIGNDLTFCNTTSGSPSILIENINIAS